MAALTGLNLHCFLAIFLLLCYNPGYQQVEGKRFIIVDIKSHVNREKIDFKSYIHENNVTFDMFITLIKPLSTHDLLMSLKLKQKIGNNLNYRNIFHMRRIDVCKFLANDYQKYLTRSLFKVTPLTLSQLTCPVKPGMYNFTNLMVDSNNLVDTLDLGYYRFYIDVAQVSSAAVKLMDLQITTINQL